MSRMDNGTAAEMERLRAERGKAAARVSEREAQARSARDGLVAAREALVMFEGSGSTSASARRRLEEELAAAQALAGAPWPERVEGAGGAVRAAQQAIQAFGGGPLMELVAIHEAEGG